MTDWRTLLSQNLHQDLLQGDVLEQEDEYDNDDDRDLIASWDEMKSVVWMEWSERRCPEAPLLLRVPIEAYVDLVDLAGAAAISTIVDQVGFVLWVSCWYLIRQQVLRWLLFDGSYYESCRKWPKQRIRHKEKTEARGPRRIKTICSVREYFNIYIFLG